ncbi:hypothetical protein [Rudanella paleaurantiibacter]|uniref:hypothetical protein n=1 Tax=Rudanella paleaurantiibacter TaxID=2614655 RepID=UPI001C87AE83|nr:hypothetical protein [Rudanella paleaurantiibacter]
MKNIQDELSLPERLAAPTPRLFGWIRNAGIVLAALAGAVAAIDKQGVYLPDLVLVLADKAYFVAGLVATLISQLTVDLKAYRAQNALK